MTLAPETAAQHQEAATTLLLQFRELAHSVPGFTHLSLERRRKINVSVSLPNELLLAVGIACDAHEQLSLASQLTGAECRGEVAFGAGYTALANELEILARGIRDAVASRRYDVMQRALRVYNLAKRLNQPEDREVLIPHIEAMARTFARTKARTATPPPSPPPATGGTTTGGTTTGGTTTGGTTGGATTGGTTGAGGSTGNGNGK